jgi:hypothetical protein
LFVLAVAGCGFRHGALAADDMPPDDASADAASDAASDASRDAALDARIAPFCDPQDPDLVACYEFEDTTDDASGHNLDATSSNIAYVTGKQGKAMSFGATSSAEVADSTLLDVSGLTIEAWIKPTQLPTTGMRMGIVDMNGQWGFFLEDTGEVRCIANVAAQGGTITANQWAHVACTYDNGSTTAWVNGGSVATTTGGTGLATASTSGMSIAADNPAGSGSRLIGLIDQLRIFGRARTGPELCADANCP